MAAVDLKSSSSSENETSSSETLVRDGVKLGDAWVTHGDGQPRYVEMDGMFVFASEGAAHGSSPSQLGIGRHHVLAFWVMPKVLVQRLLCTHR